ncbi:transporter substrate-binding domain-containing protein [Rhizobium sp. XQZ8]|uniref:substrate-binding periplasmic protein n=1 Tax=Rhizobium populisoli TaxID=2859785 RepID=UPI001C669130|nr:transporter substrate-binding domain-containing protein [Rhizobium populisoli]MBW6423008.1 transporter substrate-binding domain-containing protein [Rhizobium populisoli]
MKIALLLFASLGFAQSAMAEEPIVFTTESYPPFSYQEPGGNYRGVGIDQVDIVMKEAGAPYTLEIMPWARAITLAETQSRHCVFAAARTAEREARFKWVVPLFIDRNILVRHAGSPVTASTIEEAKRFTVGTHREDYTEGVLRSLGFPKIDLSADVDTTLRKLLGDRIDMMPMSEGVYDKLKSDGTPIEKVMLFSEQHLGIACNRDVPDALIAKMQAGLDRLIRDGVQAAILKRYGINEPQ